MNLKNNTVLGKISFGISLLILVSFLELTFHDVIFPIDIDNPTTTISIYHQYQDIIFMLVGLLSVVNFVLGITTLFQKKSNKKLAIVTIIISLPLTLPCIIAYIKGLMIRFGIL